MSTTSESRRHETRPTPSTSGPTRTNRPTGPFVSAAAATHAPDTHANPMACHVERLLNATSTGSTEAAANSATVVSNRLPAMVHVTTGGAIQNRTGNHSVLELS